MAQGRGHLVTSAIFNPATGAFEVHVIVVSASGLIESQQDFDMVGDAVNEPFLPATDDLGDFLAETGWSINTGDCAGIVACLDATFGI